MPWMNRTRRRDVEIAPVHELGLRRMPAREPAEAEPAQHAGPADVDRHSAQLVSGASEVDVGDAADAPPRDVAEAAGALAALLVTSAPRQSLSRSS
jgi:hypothetical protein